jgi:ABC-type transporter Mla subunit MlaD
MPTIRQLANKADQALKRLGKERDRIRELLDEVEELLDDVESAESDIFDAKVALENAADTLSTKI